MDDSERADIFTRSNNIWLVHSFASRTRPLVIYYCHSFISDMSLSPIKFQYVYITVQLFKHFIMVLMYSTS